MLEIVLIKSLSSMYKQTFFFLKGDLHINIVCIVRNISYKIIVFNVQILLIFSKKGYKYKQSVQH